MAGSARHPSETTGRCDQSFGMAAKDAYSVIRLDEVDAPTGTVVFVRDPAARRAAVATEASTTALVVGGSPGRPYEVSPWEWVAEAIPAWRSADYTTARATIEKGLREHPENPSLLYDLACLEALTGETEPAIEHLLRAVELKPEYAKDALEEEDF